MISDQVSIQLGQLASIQRQRASLPELSSSESRVLGQREISAHHRLENAVEVSRARVEALLTGVSAPLLALAGQRTSMQLTPDQRLALENYLLNLEESELRRQVSALEAEAEALMARERAARAALDAIPSELQRLQQQAAEMKSADSQEVYASEAVVEASLRTVREASAAEMERVMSSWDVLESEARSGVEAEISGEIAGVADFAERALEAYTESARAKAKALAGALADAAAHEYDTVLVPLFARLDDSKESAANRGATLASIRESLAQLSDLVAAGADPGVDISRYVAGFPALESVFTENNNSSSKNPSGLPSVDVSAGAGGLRDSLGVLETCDASSLGLSRDVAREELSGLLDSVASSWAGSGAGVGLTDCTTFFRELLAVLAAGCEKPVSTPRGETKDLFLPSTSSGRGLDIVAEVREETARALQTL